MVDLPTTSKEVSQQGIKEACEYMRHLLLDDQSRGNRRCNEGSRN